MLLSSRCLSFCADRAVQARAAAVESMHWTLLTTAAGSAKCRLRIDPVREYIDRVDGATLLEPADMRYRPFSDAAYSPWRGLRF